MKKNIIIVSLFLILISSFYYVFLQYRNAFKIDNDGYVFTSNKIIEQLYVNNLKNSESGIDYIPIKENEQVYTKAEKYYVGDETKKEIMINFPIISKDGTRISNMSENMILINEKFKKSKSYNNAILVDGSLYNSTSYDKVDQEKYFLLNIQDKIFLNSTKIEINDITIPLNSIVYFMENEIRFYYLDNDTFKYKNIEGINLDDTISYYNKKITYEKFLLNLDILNNYKDDDIDSISVNKNIELNKDTKSEEKKEINKNEYIKPEVNFKIKDVSVYSLAIEVEINDMKGLIDTNPTFEIKYNNKTVLRKTVYTSGIFDLSGLMPNTEFEITGFYTYRNEKNKLIKNIITDKKYTTKDINQLEHIKLTYSNDNLYSNKIELNNIQINNNENSEVLKGIKNGEIKIGDGTFNFSNSLILKLKSMQSANYTSPTVLQSNKVYKSNIIFTDIAGNKLIVDNSTPLLKTIKEKPSANISITNTDLTYFTASIDIVNKDNVNLTNLFYVISDNSNNIIKNEKLTDYNNIKIDDLNMNEIYNFSIYANYDLEDGKGVQNNALLKTVKVSTKPISSLGFVKFNLQEKSIKQNDASYKLTINKANTDKKLIQLLDKIIISVKDKKTNKIIGKYEIEKDNLENIKDSISYDLDITNLYSNNEYKLEISTDIKQGNKIYNIKSLTNVKEFKTLKEAAKVSIINKFSNENIIDYDVKIIDIDHTIESDRVFLHVRNKDGGLISYKNLKINGDYVQLTFDKLEKEQDYKFTYSVEEYNEGYSNKTYEQDKIIFEETINTSIGIYGSIQLNSLLSDITSENLFDINNNKRWKENGDSAIESKSIDTENNIIKLAAKNGYATYSYYLPEGNGKDITVSFMARYIKNSNNANVYLSNGGDYTFSNYLEGMSYEWKKYSISIPLTQNNYIGFCIKELENQNNITTIEIKDLSMKYAITENSIKISDSYHSSDYIFTETNMSSGNEKMPSPINESKIIGNSNNGFARITNTETKEIYNFNYTGDSQLFTVPKKGKYKFEAWGAQGGTYSHYIGGKGAYTSGLIELKENDKIYVYVGGMGGSNYTVTNIGGYNGGGYSGNNSGAKSFGGGGATDFRLVGGLWNDTKSLRSRIMVAAGGGGATNVTEVSGGAAGSLIGSNGPTDWDEYNDDDYYPTSGGTQIHAGKSFQLTRTGGFGYALQTFAEGFGGGGGSGYYGGATGYGRTGAGGSSYISGYKGCISISRQEENEYSKYVEKNTYKSTFNVSLYDTKKELDNNDFYIQIIRNKTLENNIKYDIDESHKIENLLLSYNLQKNSSYEIRLCVKIRNKYYTISSSVFTTDEEIRSINNIHEFFDIHRNGKYIVTNDLDFRNTSRSLGGIFSGKIDFQGHKVIMNNDNGDRTYLINNVLSDGILSNIDEHVYLNNIEPGYKFYGLVYNLDGRITNIKVTLEESTNVANSYYSLICGDNDGIIENFVINSKSSLSGQRYISLGVSMNYGTIKNGYLYGEKINASFPVQYSEEYKRVGALVAYNASTSKVKNVYSTISIDGVNSSNSNNYNVDSQIGSIIGGQNNRSIVNNIYSYTSGNYRNLTRDANIGDDTNANINNSYYISNEVFDSKYSQKVAKSALKDPDFQNIINEDNIFIINDCIQYGFYPHIKWPINMPIQEYNSLPIMDDIDKIDITHVKNTKVDDNSTIVTLMVNNPNDEEITKVNIKDIENVEILSQNTFNNKTTLVIKLSNPIKYISKYYIKSISAVSAYNKEYNREYKDSERVLLVDMYREINNEQEWLNIKEYPNENFILKNDLDFEGMPYTKFQINSFEGKLNGNGHTIKNFEVSSGQGIINILKGCTILNLNVENYKRTKDNILNENGVFGYSYNNYNNSIIDNVHVKNVTLISSKQIGGLLAYSDPGTIIKNSSATDVKVNDLSNLSNIRIGGLVGEAYQTSIDNCYTDNINLNLKSAIYIDSAGGIIGKNDTGSISNVYSSGKIETISSNVGGIVGYNKSAISNAYSNVDIKSYSDNIGGIAGYSFTDEISNCLSVGSLYSHVDSQNIKRIVGNLNISNNNYSWNESHINGNVVNISNGEILLSKKELSNELTYQQKINFGNQFDYSDLNNGKLPKLYYSDNKKLLPNQTDNYIKDYKFQIKSIDKYKTLSNATVLLTFNNPNNYEIKDIIVDDMTGEIKKNVTKDGLSTIEILLTPKMYFDSYLLSQIKYEKNDEIVSYNTDIKIDTQFYKDIEKYEDWQKISNKYAENYRLISDIDFNSKLNINHNVLINRLEGVGEEKKQIKNIFLNVNDDNQSLIRTINSKISNIEFNNITINSTTHSTTDNNGIIEYAFGTFENIDFKKITLNLDNTYHVGILVYDRTNDIRNINLDNITVKGLYETSGFISRSWNKSISNISMNNANIYCNRDYVGGIFANVDYIWDSQIYNITISNSNITGNGNYVGGIFGYGGGSNITVNNVKVNGNGDYVGGVSGIFHKGYGENIVVIDSEIHGNGNFIGGLSGDAKYISYTYIDNTKIYADNETSLYVGGITAYSEAQIDNSGVRNSIIKSKGSYVGGLVGLMSSMYISKNFITNTSIEGQNYIGGIVGGHINEDNYIYNDVDNNTIDVTVIANENGAGGIFGYVSNQTTDATTNRILIYNNIVKGTVSASNIAGGLVGRMDKMPYNGDMYSNILAVNVNATSTNSLKGIAIGSSDYYLINVNNIKIYNGSKINGNNINNLESIKDEYLVDDDWLKTYYNYTDIGFKYYTFDFDVLDEGFFPCLNYINEDYLEYIPLPSTETNNVVNTFRFMQAKLETSNLHLLPEFDIYPSDINAFNIEFKESDLLTNIKVNNDESNITNKVLTYNYDYTSDINIILSDGINQKTYKFTKDDLKNKVYVENNNYYFIKNNKLVTNNNYNENNDVLNIYNGKALLSNGKIINLKDFSILDKQNITFFKRSTIKPLYSFNYNNIDIKTYYNYSTLDNEELDKQVFVKNGNIEMISGGNELYKQSIIIDNYNNNNYLTLLNKNHNIFNLKDKIQFPNKFDNSNIVAMSNNLQANTYLIGILYENNGIIVFDYRNGNIIFNDYKNSDGLVEYYINNVIADNNENNIESNINDSYNESEELVNKLDEKGIDDVLNNNENNDNSKKYISVYNETKESYDVYDISDIIINKNLDSNNLKQSINEKISLNASLSNYYNKTNQKKHKNITNVISIFIILLIGIVYSTYMLGKNIKKAIN